MGQMIYHVKNFKTINAKKYITDQHQEPDHEHYLVCRWFHSPLPYTSQKLGMMKNTIWGLLDKDI